MVLQYVSTRTRLGSFGAQAGRTALIGRKRRGPDVVVNAEDGIASSSGQTPAATDDLKALPESFCIIESRNNVMDFASMQLEEIKNNIQSRRNRIFLLMEEVRRLRIQQRLKEPPQDGEALSQDEEQEYSSTLPFLPPLTDKTKTTYFQAYGVAVGLIIMFGGLIAPILEVRLGLGGTTYREFIDSLHLPGQLAEVDPIVAAFCGGAVGAISALLFVEFNNIEAQVKERCTYCEGSGYLTCGSCSGTGTDPTSGQRCAQCSGTTKVMCTACLCTGKKMATEHDPRFDPFE